MQPQQLAYLDRLISRTPSGRRRAPVPWDALNDIERQALPPFFRKIGRAPVPLAFGALLAMTFGLVAEWPAPFAAAVGVFAVLARAYYQAWHRTDDVTVEVLSGTERVAERGVVTLKFRCGRAAGARDAAAAMIFGVFDGATVAERFVATGPIAQFAPRQVDLAWNADRGMGRHALRDVRVVVWDDLGLFPMCVALADERLVFVEPEHQELREFVLRGSSMALEDGGLESLRPGESASFRGVRPWQSGDSMRRVDWRRSMRANELIIREFDRLASTEATFFFDQNVHGHSSFGDLNSYEALKDAAMALARWFLAHRAPVTFAAETATLPAAVGRMGEDMLAETIRDLPPTLTPNLPDLIERHGHLVPPHAVVAIFAATAGLDLERLWESLLGFDERQVEIILILTDSVSFVQAVNAVVDVGVEAGGGVQQLLRQSLQSHDGTLTKLAGKLLTRTIVLGPKDTLPSVLEEGRSAYGR